MANIDFEQPLHTFNLIFRSILALSLLSATLLAHAAGSLSGKVTDASDDTVPVYPVDIDLIDPLTGEVAGFAATNKPDGSYEITGIPAGTWKVFFNAYAEARVYLDEVYNEVLCDNGGCDLANLGEVITISDGANVLNEDLSRGIAISGSVTDINGIPIPEAHVDVYNQAGEPICCAAATDSQGTWIMSLVSAGTYYAAIAPWSTKDHIPLIWNDKPCDGCDPVADGDPIVVIDSDVGGIDFRLEAVVDDPGNESSSFSGSWYNPDRDGEGFHIEMLANNRAMVIWFTYPGITDNQQAEQAWILGTGTVSGNTITIPGAFRTRGPVFGEGYNKDDRVIDTWGDMTIIFSGPDNGLVNYDGEDGSGTTNISRITRIIQPADAGGLPPGISGAWFNPETDGQGWFVEIISKTQAVVYWFTYDQNGNQAWNLGVGDIVANSIILSDSQSGKGTSFGVDFNSNEVVKESFAAISLEFNDCNSGSVSYLVHQGSSSRLPVTRITNLKDYPCGDLPGSEDGKMYVMSNSSDPALTRYESPGGAILDLFGESGVDGEESIVNGGEMSLPNGKRFQLRFYSDQGRYEVVETKTGIQFSYTQNSENVVMASAFDPELGLTSTVTIPAQPQKTQSASKAKLGGGVSTPEVSSSAPRGKPEVGPGTQIASVTVNYCDIASTSKARVDFIMGDRSDPTSDPTHPAFLPNNGLVFPGQPGSEGDGQTYEARLPYDAPELTRESISARCTERPDELVQPCTMTASGTSICTALGSGFISEPGAALAVTGTCEEINQSFQMACLADNERSDLCTDAVDIAIYRSDFSSRFPDVWARAYVPGMEGKAWWSGPVKVGSDGGDVFLGNIELPQKGTIVESEIFTDWPGVPDYLAVAGLPYTLIFYTGCFKQNENLVLERDPSLDDSVYACTVDITETSQECVVYGIQTKQDWKTDLFRITGPQSFKTFYSVSLNDINDFREGPVFTKPAAEDLPLPNKCTLEDALWEFEWTNPWGASSFEFDLFHRDELIGSSSVGGTGNQPLVTTDITIGERIKLEDTTGWGWVVTEFFDGQEAPISYLGEGSVRICDPTWNVFVLKTGAGQGTVVSAPAGIDCGETCSADFVEGELITLTATPAQGSSFEGWNNLSCFNQGSSCSFTPTADTTVEPVFILEQINLNGTWAVNELVDGSNCDEGVYTNSYSVNMTQSGTALEVCAGAVCLDGSINGNAVQWSGSYPEDNGTTSTSVSGQVSEDGNSISGSASWSWTDGTNSCTGTTTMVAER